MHKSTSVALLSVALFGISLGAYYVYRSWQGEKPQQQSEENAQSDVDDGEKDVNETEPLSEERSRKMGVKMQEIEKDFLHSISAIETTISAMESMVQKRAKGETAENLESEVERLTTQLRSLETRQRHLVGAMRELGGDAAVEQLRTVVAKHLEIRKAAQEKEMEIAVPTRNHSHLQQAQLAHEIQHNPQFRIEREKSPLEEAVSKVAKQAFWDAVVEKVYKKDYTPFIELLNTLNTKLKEIVPSWSEEVDSNIDSALIAQVLEHSKKIDQSMLRDIIAFYAASAKRLDTPANDKSTDEWLQQTNSQLEKCTDESMCIMLIPEIFQWLLDKMEQIETAILNFRVQQIKPFLQEHGTDYVRAKFNESVMKGGDQKLEVSTAWLRSVIDAERTGTGLDFAKIEAGDSVSTLTLILRALVYHISAKKHDGQSRLRQVEIPELLLLDRDKIVEYNERWVVMVLSVFMTMRLKQVLKTEGVPISSLTEESAMKAIIVGIISRANKRGVDQPIIQSATAEETSVLKQKIARQSPEVRQDNDQEERYIGPRFTKIEKICVLSEAEMARLCIDDIVQYVEEFKHKRGKNSKEVSSAARAAIESLADPADKILGIVKDRLRTALTLQVTQETFRPAASTSDSDKNDCRQKLAVIGAALFEEEVVALAKDIAKLARQNSQLHASHYNRLIGEAVRAMK